MMTIELPQHPDCTSCDLHKMANCIGMATRPWRGGPKTHNKALLILGSHPGYVEDKEGRPFVGKTGELTEQLYIAAMNLHKHADVYLNNGVRCWPRERENALPGMYTACKQHLSSDLLLLHEHYDEVVLLLTGAKVIKAFGGGQGLSTFHQGHIETFGSEHGALDSPVFATHLAAVLLPQNDPSKLRSIHEHLSMVQEYLVTGTLRMELHPEPARVGPNAPDPPVGCPLVAPDTETYGAIEDQTVFQPEKSLYVDGKKPEELVLITSLAWYDNRGGVQSKTYRMWDPDDVARLVAVFEACQVLLGQNFPFDLMYLRKGKFLVEYREPLRHGGLLTGWRYEEAFKKVLAPGRPIIDLTVVNFLESDQRVERSLKPLSRVMRTGEYSETEVNLKAGEKYAGRDDPALASYCEFDARCTLHNYTLLSNRIWDSNQPGSSRWTERSQKWYSDLLWLTIQMSEAGFRMGRKKLQDLECRALESIDKLAQKALLGNSKYVIGGKGSQAGRGALMREALLLSGLADDERVKITKITKRLNTGKENLSLVTDNTPLDNAGAKLAALMREHDSLRTLVANYYRPLLTGSPGTKGRGDEKRTVLKNPQDLLRDDGFAFPTYNVVPSPYGTGDSEAAEGGTCQGRIVPRGPCYPKFTKLLKACIISRFEGGSVVWIDMSQLELRTGAMVYKDPAMIEVLSDPNRSIHGETAAWAAGRPVDKAVDHHIYQGGKHANFCMLFLGSAETLQKTVRRVAHIELPLATCRKFLAVLNERWDVLRKNQQKLIDKAVETGYIEMAVSGSRRSFIGPPDAVRRTYGPEIVNILVQGFAAMLTLSAQMDIQSYIRKCMLGTVQFANIYDAGGFDVPSYERHVVEHIARFFEEPSVLAELLGSGLEPVPLLCEIEGI